MSLSQWRAILGLAVLLAFVPVGRAQQGGPRTPRIGYVYPAGGRQGTVFQVTLGGQFLEGVRTAHVSGDGVQATVVEHHKPLTPQQANQLKDKLKELLDRRPAGFKEGEHPGRAGPSRASTKPAWTAEDEKRVAQIRKELATFQRKPNNPAIAETVTVEVAVAADAEPGERDLRLGTPPGLTNPLVFCVGQLDEFSEPGSESSPEPPSDKAAKRGKPAGANKQPKTALDPKNSTTGAEMNVTLPATVNGQIMPGDVDRYRFKARKSERLVVAASARALIPYIPDAVPGWFQATLALYDATGKELAYDDDYRFHPDPVLFYQIPIDGEYVIEIRDAIYRGREDFVYRMALGSLPFVTSIFPLGGKAGTQTTVELKGWHLAVPKLTHDGRDKRPGIYPLSVPRGTLISNPVPFAVDTLPECLEIEPNNQPGSAQPVTLPIIVNGRIDKSGDWDIFRLEGHAGDEVVAEVYARRLDSPVDSVLKLTDVTGQQLAFNDDHEDKGAGLTTHHADSWLRAALPADGSYFLSLGDTQNKGGPEYGYRLRISPPRPDFELRVVPSSLSVRGGGSVPLTVYALRRDGFSGEIPLALNDAPQGFTLSGGRVPANQDQVRMTLTASPKSFDEPISLSLEGRAMIQGREVVRPAVPAEDMMQAFAYRHLVSSKELLVTVLGRGTPKNTVSILSATPVKIPAGGTVRVQIAAPPRAFTGKIQLELSEPPDGIAIQSVSPGREGTVIVLRSDATRVKPGQKGNLIVNAFAERPSGPGDGNARKNVRRTPIGTLPALPFEIVDR